LQHQIGRFLISQHFPRAAFACADKITGQERVNQ
jgi:hypothetical protein